MEEGKNVDLAGIMQATMQVACPACGAQQRSGSAVCTACATPLSDDEEPWSIAETGAAGVVSDKVPLERASHFVLLQKTANGALQGTISDDDYRQAIFKLKFVGETGVKVCDLDVVKNKFVDEPQKTRKMAADLRKAFSLVLEGTQRMERYLQTHDLEDVKEGQSVAASGFHLMDQINDAARAAG